MSTRQDAEDYITRLTAVSNKFTQLSDHLVLQRINGVIEPALSPGIAINQVESIAQGVLMTIPTTAPCWINMLWQPCNEVAGVASHTGNSTRPVLNSDACNDQGEDALGPAPADSVIS